MQVAIYKIIAAQAELLANLHKIKIELEDDLGLDIIIENTRHNLDHLMLFPIYNTNYIIIYQSYKNQYNIMNQMTEYMNNFNKNNISQHTYTELHNQNNTIQKIYIDIHAIIIMIGESYLDQIKNMNNCRRIINELDITMETFYELLFNYYVTKNYYILTGIQIDIISTTNYNYNNSKQTGKINFNPDSNYFSGQYEYNNKTEQWQIDVNEDILPNFVLS